MITGNAATKTDDAHSSNVGIT